MKKWGIGVVIAVMAATFAGSAAAHAAGYGGHHRWYAENSGEAFAVSCPRETGCWRDADGGGERDPWDCWADGEGRCALWEGLGYGYVDADNDGLCDHYGFWQTGSGGHGGRHCQW